MQKYKDGKHFDNASVTIYKEEEVDGKSRLVLEEENIVPWKDKV